MIITYLKNYIRAIERGEVESIDMSVERLIEYASENINRIRRLAVDNIDEKPDYDTFLRDFDLGNPVVVADMISGLHERLLKLRKDDRFTSFSIQKTLIAIHLVLRVHSMRTGFVVPLHKRTIRYAFFYNKAKNPIIRAAAKYISPDSFEVYQFADQIRVVHKNKRPELVNAEMVVKQADELPKAFVPSEIARKHPAICVDKVDLKEGDALCFKFEIKDDHVPEGMKRIDCREFLIKNVGGNLVVESKGHAELFDEKLEAAAEAFVAYVREPIRKDMAQTNSVRPVPSTMAMPESSAGAGAGAKDGSGAKAGSGAKGQSGVKGRPGAKGKAATRRRLRAVLKARHKAKREAEEASVPDNPMSVTTMAGILELAQQAVLKRDEPATSAALTEIPSNDRGVELGCGARVEVASNDRTPELGCGAGAGAEAASNDRATGPACGAEPVSNDISILNDIMSPSYPSSPSPAPVSTAFADAVGAGPEEVSNDYVPSIIAGTGST